MIEVLPPGYEVRCGIHGFWSPFLNGDVLRKERQGVFRSPPVLCNSEQEAIAYAVQHAALRLAVNEQARMKGFIDVQVN